MFFLQICCSTHSNYSDQNIDNAPLFVCFSTFTFKTGFLKEDEKCHTQKHTQRQTKHTHMSLMSFITLFNQFEENMYWQKPDD